MILNPAADRLTDGEILVMLDLADPSLCNERDIAAHLDLSEHTVHAHKKNIYAKLGQPGHRLGAVSRFCASHPEYSDQVLERLTNPAYQQEAYA